MKVFKVRHFFKLVTGDGDAKDLISSRQMVQEKDGVSVMRPGRVTDGGLRYFGPRPGAEAVDK
jgi:hypothetical protein